MGSLLLASGLTCLIFGSLITWGYVNNFGTIEVIVPTKYVITASIILIVVGVILLLAGFSSFFNACFDRKRCLWLFFILLSLVFILMTVAAVLGFVFRNKLEESLENLMNTALNKYDVNTDVRKVVNEVQTVFQCCGVHGASDWWYTFYGRVPYSCSDLDPETEMVDETNGCYTKLKHVFDKNITFVIGGTVGVMLVIVLGMFISCALICCKKSAKKGKQTVVSYAKLY